MIFQSFDSFLVCLPLRWHSAAICDVTTVQLSNGTVQKYHKILLFIYAFMIELDQPDYDIPQKI